ncbi:MAG TPA: protein kinase [Kofleriaceae bacterium]|nr:protein kinase [Kofleriaceae bacterium]
MLVAGTTLADRFELRRRIGAGGMGEVFEAFDLGQGELIALKTLARVDADTVTRFKREFRALQATEHPNLVSLRELVRDGDHWFFTMELVHGHHFLEHVGRDPAAIRGALQQLVTGLRALHDAGLIHRDLKPSNVMVTPEGRVVLLDFGLITAVDPGQQSSEAHAVGTIEYMSPEQAVGRPLTEASDWYAVGVMLYEALTGRVPHVGHPMQILIDKQQFEPVPPESLAPGAPADLAQLCRELLRIEPSERPDAVAVARRLGLDATPRASASIPVGRRVFVGRARELDALTASLAAARAAPLVHLILGESGIGKSELAAQLVTRARGDEAALLVLRGRCYERESVPYQALDSVVDELVQHLAALPPATLAALLPPRPDLLIRLFPVFQRIEAIASAPVQRDDRLEPHERRRRSFAELRALLHALTATRPVLITIDDLHWADPDSFLLLAELLRGAGAPRLLVVATARVAPDPARLAGVVVHHTTLGPLTGDESRALAEHMLPASTPDADVARIARDAAGHPMVLAEMIRHVGTAGGSATTTFEDALWTRIGLLRSDARQLLEAICVAGAPIGAEVAAAACRLAPAEVRRAAASLRAATLVREAHRGGRLTLEPYHDRIRESVAARLAPDARAELHGRLATAIESSGEPRDPQLLLRHFQLAGRAERAAPYAEEAARRSLDAHAFDQAAEMWRTALALVERTRDERRPLLLQLGAALVAAGRCAEAADVYLEATEGADDRTRLECQSRAAEQLLISGRLTPGLEVLDRLLAQIGVQAPATPRRALLSLVRHRLQLRLRGLGFRERQRHEIPEAELLRLDVLRIAAQGLAMVEPIRGADFQARHLLLALRLGYPSPIFSALILEADHQATHAHFARAERLIAQATALAGDTRDPYRLGEIAFSHAMLAYFRGDAAAALDGATTGEGWLRRAPGSNWERASMLLFAMFAMRFIGDYGAMRVRYDDYLAEARQRGDQYLESTLRRVSVPMWLAFDDPAEAIRDLDRATWVPSSVGFHVQHFHELVARGETALYTRAPADRAQLDDAFARLERSLLLRVASIRMQHDYLRGRLALAGDPAPRVAERHARRLAGEPSAVARTWAPVLRAGAACARGRHDLAIPLLDQAATAAAAAGMRLTAAAARLRLAALRDDPALASPALAELAALSIRNPARMAELLIPLPGVAGG